MYGGHANAFDDVPTRFGRRVCNRWLIDTQEQHPALSALAFFLAFLCLVYVQVRYICPTQPPHGAPFPEW